MFYSERSAQLPDGANNSPFQWRLQQKQEDKNTTKEIEEEKAQEVLKRQDKEDQEENRKNDVHRRE